VIASLVAGHPPMTALEPTIAAIAGLRAGASSDAVGQVIATCGECDFETLCATIALCRPQLESAADMLALGTLQVASFVHGEQSVFARLGDDGADVFLGGPARSPDATAQRLALVVERR
jgi:hypothetical protein